MRKNIFIMLLLLAIVQRAAADPVTAITSLTGRVTDAIDHSRLVGVTVYIPELAQGTTTDGEGRYRLTNLPRRTVTVQVSYLGHQTIIQEVDLRTTTSLDFVMKESNAMLEEVVVTGLTGKALMKDSPTPLSVVGTQQLRTTSSTNIIDAISHQPGLAQITTGGGISKPVIRGLGFNRLVVVDDGIRQEGNQWGAEHGIEVDAQGVSSAEILKGPASLMYGSDALAGVIIFHGSPAMAQGTMQANVATGYQSNNGLLEYSLNMSGNQGGVVWGGRWSAKMAHDYKNKYNRFVTGTQYREQAAKALVGANQEWGHSHLTLGYYHLTPGIAEGRTAASGHYGKRLPFQQIHHYKAVSDNAIYLGSGTLHAIVGYQQNRRQEFEEQAHEPGLDMQLHSVNYDLKYLFAERRGWKMAAGMNGMYQHNRNKGEEALIPDYHLFDLGAFTTATLRLSDLTLSGGLRLDNRHLHSHSHEDHFSAFSRNFTSLSGSIGAVYALSTHMNLRLNMARGFRAPNLGELASNGVHEGTQQYVMGNSQLKPEHSWQVDAGWDYTSDWLSAQLSLFANLIDNYIYDHRLEGIVSEGLPVYQYTQGNARLMGGEAMIDLHPVERLHFQNTFAMVNSVLRHQPREAKYLPWTPAPRWTADLRYDLIRDGKVLDNTYVAASLECNLRQDHYYAAHQTETATPSYTLLNLAAGTDLRVRNRRWASLYLTANNLFDRAYQSHLSRLKYLDVYDSAGRRGIFNMGRNFGAKLLIYLF